MIVTIQSKTKPDNPKPGLKFGDEWHDVVGPAANFLENIQQNDTVEIKQGESGEVVYVKKVAQATLGIKQEVKKEEPPYRDYSIADIVEEMQIMQKEIGKLVEMELKMLEHLGLKDEKPRPVM